MENKLYGKTIIWDGDSICAGTDEKGNWARRIAERNSMTYKNYAVGGGVITESLQPTESGEMRHCVSLSLEQMQKEFPDADYIVLEGGTNDADLIEVYGCNGRLGSVDLYDFSGNYDRNTFCGALESIFYRAINYWYGKKICCIIPQKMGPEEDKFKVRALYFEKVKEICGKWGIPCVDLWHTCLLNPYLSVMYNSEKTSDENNEENICMYCDGQHLTSRGYDYTSDIIETFLRTL